MTALRWQIETFPDHAVNIHNWRCEVWDTSTGETVYTTEWQPNKAIARQQAIAWVKNQLKEIAIRTLKN